MLQQLLELYKRFENNRDKFANKGLDSNFFIDIYRSQPFDPELYEYFSLPAVFVDYIMQGQGINKPRLIIMTLHIVTDELPDASNISQQKDEGLKRFLYHLAIQEVLEGCKLGRTTPLKFVTENIIDESVVNYHTQSYEFEAYLHDMIDNVEVVLGEFEHLNIYGTLRKKLLNRPKVEFKNESLNL